MSEVKKCLLPMPTPRGPEIADNNHLIQKELAAAQVDGADSGVLFGSCRSHDTFNELASLEVTTEISDELEKAFGDIIKYTCDRLATVKLPEDAANEQGQLTPGADSIFLPYNLLAAFALLSSAIANIGHEMSVTARYQLATELVRNWAAMGAFTYARAHVGMSPQDVAKLPSVRGCVTPPSLSVVATLALARKNVRDAAKSGEKPDEATIQAAMEKIRSIPGLSVVDAAKRGKVPGEPDDGDDMMF